MIFSYPLMCSLPAYSNNIVKVKNRVHSYCAWNRSSCKQGLQTLTSTKDSLYCTRLLVLKYVHTTSLVNLHYMLYHVSNSYKVYFGSCFYKVFRPLPRDKVFQLPKHDNFEFPRPVLQFEIILIIIQWIFIAPSQTQEEATLGTLKQNKSIAINWTCKGMRFIKFNTNDSN